MHESACWFACGLPRLLCLYALGACPGGFLFWSAFILSVVRRLLRLSWLGVLWLLPGLLRLWLGRLLSALVAASVLRRVLWWLAQVGWLEQVGRGGHGWHGGGWHGHH